jgi:cobalt-zinc-cadmium efflux system outer membrane protein
VVAIRSILARWRAPRLSLLLLLCLVSLAPSAPAADDPIGLVDEALAANPGLEALRARIAELRELAGAAGTWDDPVIAVEYSNVPKDSWSLSDHPMSGVQLRAQQVIRPWSWSRRQKEVADSRTATSRYALAEAEVQLRREVLVSFWKLTLSRMLEDLTRDHVARTEELLRVVQARYETGLAGQHEILRLGILRDRLRDDLGDFARVERELSAALSRTLSRPPDTEFVTPELLEPKPVSGTVSDWLALARTERPELKRLEESIRTAQVAAEVARVDGIPDVTVWMGYRIRTIDTPQDDGTDQVSAGISVPIPLGSGRRSRAERAAHLHAAHGSRARLTAELDRLEAELTTIHARWVRALEQALDYQQTLTPAARAALETSFAAYAVGRADFSTLYEAEVELLEIERTLRSAAVQTHIRAAEAHAAIGAALGDDQP